MSDYLHMCELTLADAVSSGDVIPFPLFPIGTWKSAKYPNLPLTRDLAETLIANFEAGILGTEPMLDSSGKHDTSAPAAAWFKRLHIEPTIDGGEMLFGDGQVTEIGAELLNGQAYKYLSIELGPVVDNRSGAKTDDVFKSGTLTNTPVLRMMPAVLEAAGHIAVKLSEITAADAIDPVQELLDELSSLAGKLDERLKGKKGMPSARTFLRELRGKIAAYSLADPPPEDSDPTPDPAAVSEPVSHDAKGDEGDAIEASEAAADPKGAEPMKTVIQALKLAEDVDEAAVLAAVQTIIDERDAVTTKLAEAEQAQRKQLAESKVDELISGGHLAPAEKPTWLSLAEAAPEQFEAMSDAAKARKVIDLSEHGAPATQGDEVGSYANASVELSEKAKTRASKDGVTFASAMSLVLAEDADLAARYDAFRTGKEA
ncbi:phage protease [Zavarzinia sp.]|jgi:hypothetical protein|uniref:phage protease n=1 Tax=Zavarzinia sp. TaxID=2027920 RepID=UPI00356A1CF3